MTDPASAASTQRAESPGRLARPLIRLAHAYGVATSFIDQLGTYVENSDEAIAGVLAALGVDASTPEAIDASIARVRRERKERLIIPTIVATVGEATDVPVNCEASDHPMPSSSWRKASPTTANRNSPPPAQPKLPIITSCCVPA